MEDVVVLVLKLMSERVSFQDVLELCQELKGIFDVTKLGEVLVDEVLKLGIKSGDFNVKLDVIFVKFCLFEFEKRVAFAFEVLHLSLKLSDQILNPFKIMLLQRIKLLFRLKDLNQLKNPSFKDIKLPKNLRLTEIEV